MWAPADLFSRATSPVLLSVRKLVTYFWEHPLVLVAVVLVAGAVIALLESRTGTRSDPKR